MQVLLANLRNISEIYGVPTSGYEMSEKLIIDHNKVHFVESSIAITYAAIS